MQISLNCLAVSILAWVFVLPPLKAGDTRVLIWDERQPEQKQGYDTFLGEAIGRYLIKQGGFVVKYGSLEMPEYGLDDASLDDTDVIIWWGHKKNSAVAPERAEAVVTRVLEGRMGFIGIHSSIHARPFLRLMEERAKLDAVKGKSSEEKAAITFEFRSSPPKGVAFDPAMRAGIVRGMYLLERPHGTAALRPAVAAAVRLLGSGAILGEVRAAAVLLKEDFGLDAEVWSVTSFTELHKDGLQADRARMQSWRASSENAPEEAHGSWVSRSLAGSNAPVIAASDYVRALPELIRAQIKARYVTLGTDGFGRSDTRAQLRRFFEVDRQWIVVQALIALAEDGTIARDVPGAAMRRYGLDADCAAPWLR